MRATLLACCFALAALLPTGPRAAEPIAKRVEELVARLDLDGLALVMASTDPEQLLANERPRVAAALVKATREAAGRGDPSKALFFGQRAAELDPGADRSRWLAGVAQEAGDAKIEAGALDALLRSRPDEKPALARRAALFEAQGDFRAALVFWKRAAADSADPKVKQALEVCQARVDEAASRKPPDAPAAKPGPASPKEPVATPRAGPDPIVVAPRASSDSRGEHFRLAYSDKGGQLRNREYEQKVLEVLERVWTFVCPKIDRCPVWAVPVMLYTSQEYAQRFGDSAHGSRDGFFGGAINVSWAQEMTPGVEDLLAHEFVHAVIHSRGPAPKWIHEGFATYWAGLFGGSGRGHGGFIGTSECQGIRAAAAPALADLDERYPWWGSYHVSRPGYDYACAVARHLESGHPGQLGVALEALGKGRSIDEGLKAAYGVDLAGLDAEVRATLPP